VQSTSSDTGKFEDFGAGEGNLGILWAHFWAQ
jgi:hypothetical protein